MLPAGRRGLAWGLLGVVAFSFTVVLTRIALGGLSPLLIGAGRAVVAGLLAALALRLTRQRRPTRVQLARLGVVAAGIVLGFPLLTSYALRTVPAAHGAVVIAVLPAATALVAVLRTGERPARRFWGFAAAGALAAVGFATTGPSGFGDVRGSDLLLGGAVLAAAVGYAEGGLLARELGAWQTISWALVVVLPVVLVLAAAAAVTDPPHASAGQWLAFGYLAVVSMYLGFFAWYRGLAIGPMARVSQVQLVQPVLTIAWAVLLLREPLSWTVVAGGLVVVGCAALTVRNRPTPNPSKENR